MKRKVGVKPEEFTLSNILKCKYIHTPTHTHIYNTHMHFVFERVYMSVYT